MLINHHWKFSNIEVDIKNITEDEITGTYTHGKYQYVIKFFRTKDNHIEYSIENSGFGYWLLLIFILFVLYKNQNIFPALGIVGIIFLIIYLVNNQVKVGIYNRINERREKFVKSD